MNFPTQSDQVREGRPGQTRLGALGALLLAGLLLAGGGVGSRAAEPAAAAPEPIYDPLEPLNRTIFVFNDAVDTMAIRPAGEAYQVFVPPEVRARVTNVLRNLKTPITFANDVLQGDGERALDSLARFVINATIGILGLFDPASRLGFPYHDEDFGQTLAVWGVGDGIYLVLPVLGPSNPRDTVGLVADYLADPLRLWLLNTEDEAWLNVRTGARIVDGRARTIAAIDDVKRTSLDYYAAIRSLYSQRRGAEIRNVSPGGDGGVSVFFPMTDPGSSDGGR
ncbi:MAG: VacJ family lipoprotein [Proteobacteria bacterium]|nr:VacJ family lipoprotein [Pseudomonadota bacterium]